MLAIDVFSIGCNAELSLCRCLIFAAEFACDGGTQPTIVPIALDSKPSHEGDEDSRKHFPFSATDNHGTPGQIASGPSSRI